VFVRQYDAPECKRQPHFRVNLNLPSGHKTHRSYVAYMLNKCHIHSGKYSNKISLHRWHFKKKWQDMLVLQWLLT